MPEMVTETFPWYTWGIPAPCPGHASSDPSPNRSLTLVAMERFSFPTFLAVKASAPFLNPALGLGFADFGKGEFHRMWGHFL